MKFKRVLLSVIIVAAAAITMAVSASAETMKGLSVTNRYNDYAGFDIKLSELIPAVENGDQGTYTIEALVFPLDDFSIAGPSFKILTQSGETPPAYVRFTPWDPITEETYYKSTASGDDPDSGDILAETLAAAAGSDQMLRFQTQTDMNGFIVKALIITHHLDGVDTVVYNLNDELQFLNVGDTIEDTMAGRFTVRCGTPTLTVVENDIENSVFFTPSVMEYTEPEIEEETEPLNDETEPVIDETETEAETVIETTTASDTDTTTEDGGLSKTAIAGIVIGIAALVIIAVIVVVVKKKK